MSQYQDSNKLDTKHLVIGESRSVPSSRRNSGHNPNAFQLQPNMQHNLSTNVLNVNGSYTTANQMPTSQFQLMNRRPSSSTAIVTTASGGQFHGSQTVLSQTGMPPATMAQSTIKTASSVSTLTVNQAKNKGDHLSSSTNHLTTLDPMSGYVGAELVKTSSATLTTTNCAQAASKQFLDVNNNSTYGLRRKSSSALSNASQIQSQMQFNRTLSLRSNSTNEAEIVNTVNSSGLQAGVMTGNSISANAINSAAIEQQKHPMQQQPNQQHPNQQHLNQQHPNQQHPNQMGLQNQTAIQNPPNDYALTRQASIQMRSGSIMMKSMTDVDKQTTINKPINFSSTSITSALATPLRRPSNTGPQMQPRCISAMDNLRRRPLSISANSCSSSDELTDDTESLSKAGTKHEVDSCLRSGKIIGEIKLSIVMTKGLLEIDILEAKLQNPNNNPNKPGEWWF